MRRRTGQQVNSEAITRARRMTVKIFNTLQGSAERGAVEVCQQALGLPSFYCPDDFQNLLLGPFLRYVNPLNDDDNESSESASSNTSAAHKKQPANSDDHDADSSGSDDEEDVLDDEDVDSDDDVNETIGHSQGDEFVVKASKHGPTLHCDRI